MDDSTKNFEDEALDDLILKFDEEWYESGCSPSIEEYATQIEGDRRSELVRELALIDMENRWQTGDFKDIHGYAKNLKEILDEPQFFPTFMTLKQFELEWVRFVTHPNQWESPKIDAFLSNPVGEDGLAVLFWQMVEIEYRPENVPLSQPELESYTKLYKKLFPSIPVIPIELIERQFQIDWKKSADPEIKKYLTCGSQADRLDLCVRLIQEDIVNRWNLGNPKWIEAYMEDFPELLSKDGEIPEDLVLRERALAFAVEINSKKIRCPFCHAIQKKRAHLAECESCARIFQQQEQGITLPECMENYQIIKILGIGGFGTVYKAWDKNSLQIIALKCPNPTQLSARKINRFEREAKIASRLNHPNIVGIHDYKIGLNSNRSYIAYHYVNGFILTRLVKDNKRDIGATLKVMIQICKAVGFAHKNRVIHRDLKPRNILINEQGNPLISDFGLARISTFIQDTKHTGEGQIIGTPEYMSPEQFQGKVIDYRSDIYSLGVLFYELTTGSLPFSYKNVGELRQKICHDKPAHPSKLNSELPPEVDTICFRALEKSPSKRYLSADHMAGDLQNLVEGRQVLAQPPSLLGRFFSWCWWNPRRVLVGTGKVIFVSIFIVAVVLLLKPPKPEKPDDSPLWQKRIQQLDKHYSRLELHEIKRLPYYLVHQDNEVYQQTFSYLHEHAEKSTSQPDLILGAYKRGEFDPVLDQLSSKPQDRKTFFHFGNIHFLQNNYSASLRDYQEALKLSALHRSDELHHEILQRIGETHMALGDCAEAQKFFVQALKAANKLYGKLHEEIADNWVAMGDAWYCLANYKKSEKCFTKAYEMDLELFETEHPNIARDLDRLAGVWHDLGHLEKAKKGFEEALFLFINEYEYEHITVARASWHIGNTYYSLGDYQSAYRKFKNALLFYQMYYGQLHPQVSSALNHVGGALNELKKNSEALETFEKALKIDQELAKSDLSNRANVARDWTFIGGAHFGLGNYEKAIDSFNLGLDAIRKIKPIDSSIVAQCLGGLGSCWMRLGKFDESKKFYQETLGMHVKKFGDQHHYVAQDLMNLSRLAKKMEDLEKAELYCQQANKINKKVLGVDHPKTIASVSFLKDLENEKIKHRGQ